jgi:hypothetical protein
MVIKNDDYTEVKKVFRRIQKRVNRLTGVECKTMTDLVGCVEAGRREITEKDRDFVNHYISTVRKISSAYGSYLDLELC